MITKKVPGASKMRKVADSASKVVAKASDIKSKKPAEAYAEKKTGSESGSKATANRAREVADHEKERAARLKKKTGSEPGIRATANRAREVAEHEKEKVARAKRKDKK